MGLTLDTGALIGLERARHAMRKVFAIAVTHEVPIVVPVVVVAEWWREGRYQKERAAILRGVVVEALTDHVARLAGVALSRVPTAQTIDAVVMASAAQRPGEVVYTSDVKDLEALRDGVREFRHVRIQAA
jgi:hypothetical protein